jgi:hypothetical protein
MRQKVVESLSALAKIVNAKEITGSGLGRRTQVGSPHLDTFAAINGAWLQPIIVGVVHDAHIVRFLLNHVYANRNVLFAKSAIALS